VQPLWRLLAAEHAPLILGVLQTHLFDGGRSIPASIFHDTVERELEDVRATGVHMPQTAQAYVAEWLRSGFVERRFPAGSTEEEFELSAASAAAIRFVSGLAEPRAAATESRLAVVIDRLVRLATETDSNPERRVAALLAERERLDERIAAVRDGRADTLTSTQAIERTRDIVAMAEDLAGDFRRVRERFESLNRDLRQRLVDDDDSRRGAALQGLFEGMDLIADSDAGRTFSSFWRLLTDAEQSAALEESVEQILSREFAAALMPPDRRFLQRLLRILLEQGGSVHEVLQHFARSLKQFVQSREFQEQRRLNGLIREAQRAAMVVRDDASLAAPMGLSLVLSSSSVRSLAQWTLWDPSLHAFERGMPAAADAFVALESIAALVAGSEIDFRSLEANVAAVLRERDEASIADVLARFPASQGLGSVVGYVALGSRNGLRTPRSERVCWEGPDGGQRCATIPAIFFLRSHWQHHA